MHSDKLEAFIEYITVTKALSYATIEAYSHDLKQIEEHFKTSLFLLNSEKIFTLLSRIENRRTLNRKLSSLNAFYDFCYREEYIDERKKFQQSKVPKNLPKFLEYEEIARGLEMIDCSKWIGLRDYSLILFLYATGLRVSEALNVRRDDFEDEWLRVRHGKGEKERIVPVANEAIEAIKIYLNASPFNSNMLWINYLGRPLSRISAFKTVQKYLNVSPHVLRHSYATALILGGADLRVVQELLGHSSLLTTQVYTHIQKQNLLDTLKSYHPISKEA